MRTCVSHEVSGSIRRLPTVLFLPIGELSPLTPHYSLVFGSMASICPPPLCPLYISDLKTTLVTGSIMKYIQYGAKDSQVVSTSRKPVPHCVGFSLLRALSLVPHCIGFSLLLALSFSAPSLVLQTMLAYPNSTTHFAIASKFI